MQPSDRVEVIGELLGATEKAVKVRITLANGAKSDEWFPRSQIADQTRNEDTVGMTIPRWLATDRGLV